MRKLIYVVRTEDNVEITTKKPKDLEFFPGKRKWYTRSKSFCSSVGQSDCGRYLYTDDPWIGPIGVYDISKQSHVMTMIDQFRAHLNSIKLVNVQREVGKIAKLKTRAPRIGHLLITADPFTEHSTPLGEAIKDGFGMPECLEM